MSELSLLLPKLNEQLNQAIENLSFAETTQSDVLIERYSAEVEDLKDMIMHIEKPEITRHLRLVANNAWREFNGGVR